MCIRDRYSSQVCNGCGRKVNFNPEQRIVSCVCGVKDLDKDEAASKNLELYAHHELKCLYEEAVRFDELAAEKQRKKEEEDEIKAVRDLIGISNAKVD